jgi:hypothetical protein
MRRFPLAALLVLAVLSPLAVPLRSEARPSGAKDKGKEKDPAASAVQTANDCAQVQASARYVGYGYTHVVTLKNTCNKAVECALWTDVDPERTTLQADAGQTAELVTRRGSPSREVTAYKSCSFR